MKKLAIPIGLYVTQGILALVILGILITFTPAFQQSGIITNSEPIFSDTRIVEIQVITRPAQGVEIYYVPRNEISTFNY